ncbi:Hypothetical protein PHPALM_20036 [Phytophthora palmivora]|uniref:M96 mating-specific protein family n=1 Tax=Phytophthora palmivora TaxID=4796 RepID=A0A2P4XFW0_9STRA|nr:Hypothetical protein PHPALM_20036 [Phytophthora palmivora]
MLTSKDDFENFMKSLVPSEYGPSASDGSNSNGVGTKRAPSPVAAQRPKRCRKTNKQEIDRLRAVATELEKKLKELNQRRNQGNPDSDSFWMRVSNRLLEQRQKSVKENARLRDLVLQQMTILKSVQRSLEKTPVVSQKDVFPEVKKQAVASCQSKEIYQDLFRNLSVLYSTGVSTMLRKPREASPSLDGSKRVNIEIEKDSHNGLHMCLQVVETKLIPSSFEKVREKAWKILTGTNGHEGFELVCQPFG